MPGLLSSRPLLDNPADLRFFVDREAELDQAEKAVDLGFNALVTGPRGSGKTSFLRRLAYRLRERGEESLFMDGAALDSAADLLAVLRERLFGPEVVTVTHMMKQLERIVGTREVRHQTATSQLLALIDSIRAAFEGEEGPGDGGPSGERAPRIVLLDGLPREGGHQLFGRLRDELWALPLTWIVAADPQQAGELGPPADAFFESALTLRPLGERDARDLLVRRLPTAQPVDEEMVGGIVQSSDGLPRSLVQGLRSVIVEGRSPGAVAARRDERSRLLASLGESAVRLAEELDASGEASASDEAFLARVGLSRASASRLLRQMEAEGLVRSSRETRESRGRPRRVYRPAEAGREDA